MKKLILLVVGSLGLTNCIAPNPESELSLEERDVYLSNYSDAARFSSYKTYSLVDSVLYVSQNSSSQVTRIRQRQAIDIAVFQTIETEMAKMNYTKVDFSANPDVIVDASRITVTSTGTGVYYTNPYYSGGYYGSYYGGYGLGSVPVVYSYQETNTSFNIDMFDAKNVGSNQELPDVWSGVILGQIQGNSPELQTRLINGIQGIFAQSPYLKNGK